MGRHRDEEPDPIVVPEPDEPDEPDEPETEPGTAPGTARAAAVPSVVAPGDRHYDYRVEVITNAQVLDGTSLPKLLSSASEEEWQLVEIIDAGDSKAVLLRKRKESKSERRPVGFTVRA